MKCCSIWKIFGNSINQWKVKFDEIIKYKYSKWILYSYVFAVAFCILCYSFRSMCCADIPKEWEQSNYKRQFQVKLNASLDTDYENIVSSSWFDSLGLILECERKAILLLLIELLFLNFLQSKFSASGETPCFKKELFISIIIKKWIIKRSLESLNRRISAKS